VFSLTPSDGFLYLQITLELEPISKMWITISGWPVEPVGPVEPVEIGKMYDFIFPRANGLTGSTQIICIKGQHSYNPGAVRNSEARQ
jgi:hypothetical protein